VRGRDGRNWWRRDRGLVYRRKSEQKLRPLDRGNCLERRLFRAVFVLAGLGATSGGGTGCILLKKVAVE